MKTWLVLMKIETPFSKQPYGEFEKRVQARTEKVAKRRAYEILGNRDGYIISIKPLIK